MPSFQKPILDLRKKGWSYRRIASEVGCSKATVAYHCSRLENNQEILQRNLEHLRRVSNVPRSTQALLLWLLEDGVRRSDAADALRISPENVRLFAKEQGVGRPRTDLTNYERVKRRRRHLKMLAVARSGGRCRRCGYHKSIRALDFHHPDPSQKDFHLSQNANRSWAAVREEVDKCVLLCANCHREEHDTIALSGLPLPLHGT